MSQNSPSPRDHRIDFLNPVGTGIAERDSDLIGKPAPSIESSGQTMRGTAAGFGAIPSYWSPRKELAGTYDEKWAVVRRPLLPLDYDPKCLLCSPSDEQVPAYLFAASPSS